MSWLHYVIKWYILWGFSMWFKVTHTYPLERNIVRTVEYDVSVVLFLKYYFKIFINTDNKTININNYSVDNMHRILSCERRSIRCCYTI